MSDITPRLWSDFDGTAVTLVRKVDPRNWLKYPLPALDGYVDFLKGVQAAGVEIAGVVSRRPDIIIRRWATARSIGKLGLRQFFGKPGQVVHKGSEEAKGRFVAEQSRHTPIGMLEDKPHKLGAVLVGLLAEPVEQPDLPHYPILVGTVQHDLSREYLKRLLEQIENRTSGDLLIQQFADGPGPVDTTSFSLEAESFSLHVVPLGKYSEAAGQRFGNSLIKLAS